MGALEEPGDVSSVPAAHEPCGTHEEAFGVLLKVPVGQLAHT